MIDIQFLSKFMDGFKEVVFITTNKAQKCDYVFALGFAWGHKAHHRMGSDWNLQQSDN